MLILSRKSRQSVLVGENDGIHRQLKVTVIAIEGNRVRLGFEAEPDVPIHRSEVWDRMQTAIAKNKSGIGTNAVQEVEMNALESVDVQVVATGKENRQTDNEETVTAF